jgi:DNA-binding NtrC family response regulator
MRSILIIDDEVQICEMMADLFESRGYSVFMAHGGTAGAEILKTEEIDVVISDVRMADGDGFIFARLAAEILPNFSNIIFVTGYLDIEETPLPFNVARYFKKPVRFKDLIIYVEEILAQN